MRPWCQANSWSPLDDRDNPLAQEALVDRAAPDQRQAPFGVDEEVLGHAGRAEGPAALVADRAQLRVAGLELGEELERVLAVVLDVDPDDAHAAVGEAPREALPVSYT